MIQKISAVLGGILLGGLTIYLIESLGHILFPLPEGIDQNDMEAMKTYAKTAPFMAIFMVIIAYFFGALVAGFVSTKIAKDGKKVYALICGLFFLLATIFNSYVLEAPIWFWILGILVWLMVLVGYRLALSNNVKN